MGYSFRNGHFLPAYPQPPSSRRGFLRKLKKHAIRLLRDYRQQNAIPVRLLGSYDHLFLNSVEGQQSNDSL